MMVISILRLVKPQWKLTKALFVCMNDLHWLIISLLKEEKLFLCLFVFVSIKEWDYRDGEKPLLPREDPVLPSLPKGYKKKLIPNKLAPHFIGTTTRNTFADMMNELFEEDVAKYIITGCSGVLYLATSATKLMRVSSQVVCAVLGLVINKH